MDYGHAISRQLHIQLGSIRAQIEIFKGQHNDQPPQLTGMWTLLTGRSDTTEVSVANPSGTRWGPYLSSPAINPVNNKTAVSSANTDTNAGWYYQPSGIGFTFMARNIDGTVNTSY